MSRYLTATNRSEHPKRWELNKIKIRNHFRICMRECITSSAFVDPAALSCNRLCLCDPAGIKIPFLTSCSLASAFVDTSYDPCWGHVSDHTLPRNKFSFCAWAVAVTESGCTRVQPWRQYWATQTIPTKRTSIFARHLTMGTSLRLRNVIHWSQSVCIFFIAAKTLGTLVE